MLISVAVWLNRVAGAIARVLLAPIAWLPGWLSATLIAIVTGVLMLVVFKHTSNQAAISRTRNRIKANLLALSLFRDDIKVGLACQGALLLCAVRLLVLSLIPMLVMTVPMCVLLGQLGLWYQARPLSVGEEAVVTVHLSDGADLADSEVRLAPTPGVICNIGPVRVPAKHMICWNVQAMEPGCHELLFEVAGRSFTKQLAVGDGFMPTSLKRPDWNLMEVMEHPLEQPFSGDMAVRSIEVAFPTRHSWTSGSNWWILYWFVVSMLAAFAARPLLKVNI